MPMLMGIKMNRTLESAKYGTNLKKWTKCVEIVNNDYKEKNYHTDT